MKAEQTDNASMREVSQKQILDRISAMEREEFECTSKVSEF